VFSNDIICLAVAPVLVEVCLARRLNPVPFLLALACAANVGSAATLIGNPQNMLIGETLELSFAGYMREAGLPVVLGVAVIWALIAWQMRGKWSLAAPASAPARAQARSDAPPAFDPWQSAKGLAVAGVVFVLFLVAPAPREVVALVAAGTLLMSRKLHSYKMLGLVDWQLLVLFIGLFVVNEGLAKTGLPGLAVRDMAGAGFDPSQPGVLFATAFVLSNLVSNVPAVMLLLPAATHEMAGPVLALSSTLAGNLLIVGSIANIIVVNAAQRHHVALGWREHARVGVPVTLTTTAIAAGWLWFRLGAG
jgi:Na+/H+ antiporter NhaD/arsenite permease-like protein